MLRVSIFVFSHLYLVKILFSFSIILKKTTTFNPICKLALAGVYPYQNITSSSERTRTTTATRDYNHPTVSVLTIGQPIDKIPSSGIDSSVFPESSKEVAMF
ncbi:hypothetical protein CH354_17480 [Leptospira levettii]|uniref:hypothetical protein n=1 Tax=Leptospira levettii TaxID=2023178 RepID=UPI000C2B0200|nr:hypothetical protein [Leptospira levettii]PJZ35865.1 hypothetical protein CH354_17480 [Leptospira levettii]PJZ88095.1 hypothetical protein CH368_13410 [Leptospira levettii]PJZ99520.1 hypothetical protein CH369_15180 [Leptospira levettii]